MTLQPEFSSNFFRSLRKLYFSSQIWGLASFCYSPENGMQLKPVNYITLLVFTLVYWILIIGNAVMDINVEDNVRGYKYLLTYFWLRLFSYVSMAFLWLVLTSLFIFRKQMCRLMEDIIDLEQEVTNRTYSNYILSQHFFPADEKAADGG